MKYRVVENTRKDSEPWYTIEQGVLVFWWSAQLGPYWYHTKEEAIADIERKTSQCKREVYRTVAN